MMPSTIMRGAFFGIDAAFFAIVATLSAVRAAFFGIDGTLSVMHAAFFASDGTLSASHAAFFATRLTPCDAVEAERQ